MRSLASYPLILRLRLESDGQRRGYQFEQLLREIMPWDHRPPIALSTDTEQLDAFFEWNSWHFLVEAKAKTDLITAGSHDWEDFALKVRKRPGQCIGLFCALGEVNAALIREAQDLTRSGSLVLVLAGQCWDDLHRFRIPMSDFLRYMVFHAKARHVVVPPAFDEVRRWIFNRDSAIHAISGVCQKSSSSFLRRHKLIRHDKIYVPRVIDEEVTHFAHELRPSRLSRLAKYRKRDGLEYTTKRAAPRQITVVRDLSGSGKTTLCVQIASENDRYFGVARSALQPAIDEIHTLLEGIGAGLGLTQFIAADRPLIYAVDSLDEARLVQNKHNEVKGLLRALGELNQFAVQRDLLCFPIGFIVTVRDDFWRDWESLFEGAPVKTYLKRFSYFQPAQTQEALSRYADAYEFRLNVSLDLDSRRVLSHPFNMQIFAEVNEYRGEIAPEQVLDENVLALYFARKKQDLLNRPIPGFMPDLLLMPMLSAVALRVAKQGQNQVSEGDFIEDILSVAPSLRDVTSEVIRVIVSEQILVRDSEDVSLFRFRHVRFIEYLVAHHIASQLAKNRRPAELHAMIDVYAKGNFISVYYVHEFIRFICRTTCGGLYEKLTDFYAKSSTYVDELLLKCRSGVAHGFKTPSLDIDTIKKSVEAGDPNICWNGFFVVAAVRNHESTEAILSSFCAAWRKNQERPDRWKLIAKMAQHGLLLNEMVFGVVLHSDGPRDWDAFIDGVVDHGLIGEFGLAWADAGGGRLTREIASREGADWRRVALHLALLVEGKAYLRGDPEPS